MAASNDGAHLFGHAGLLLGSHVRPAALACDHLHAELVHLVDAAVFVVGNHRFDGSVETAHVKVPLMQSAQRHYEELLGGVYTWSVSASGDPCERGKNWLLSQGLMDVERYLDLGAGFGAHVLPLLAAGKQVTAVDFNAELLAELVGRAGGAPGLTTEQADLVGFLEASRGSEWDVILCLGDTLTHLEDEAAVQRLLSQAVERLSRGGRLALSYRDSSTFQAEGVARFIQVAGDRTRVMHCLLEPIAPNRMRVTDIVTEVTADGLRTRLGEYTKLRLASGTLVDWADAAGLTLARQSVEQGLTSLIFRR